MLQVKIENEKIVSHSTADSVVPMKKQDECRMIEAIVDDVCKSLHHKTQQILTCKELDTKGAANQLEDFHEQVSDDFVFVNE